MTQPQQDPAVDVGAALARLAENVVGIHRRIDNLEKHLTMMIRSERDLTDAKFVTYQTLISSQADKVALALTASEKAIGKAEIATEKRFDAVNEFRAQLADQARTFMPRNEALQLADQATSRIREVADRTGDQIRELREWRNRTEGAGQGTKDNRVAIFTSITAAVGVLSVIIIVANFVR